MLTGRRDEVLLAATLIGGIMLINIVEGDMSWQALALRFALLVCLAVACMAVLHRVRATAAGRRQPR